MIKAAIHIIFCSLLFLSLQGQDDHVLFTVNESDIRLSEFNYIYSKNNGHQADYSKASIDEYIGLYINFKLKVAEARDKKIDTLPSYIEELAGYRRQLADSYIIDKELAKNIAKEAYQRLQKDISFSHIQINLPTKASPIKIKLATEKIERAQKALREGRSFESVVEEFSEDKRSQKLKGTVGFITAILPNGYYQLESILYHTPKGKISDIVRSHLGLHIVRVDEIRPARGSMNVAQILIRKTYKGVINPNAKREAAAVYQNIKKGTSFETMVIQRSQDNNTKGKGGVLGEFGIGKYEKRFEDAAFNLKKDGDISKVVESSLGFHILKRISKKQHLSFENSLNDLIKRTKQTDRQKSSKLAFNENIKSEAGYVCVNSVMEHFVSKLGQSFYNYKWTIPVIQNDVLCKLGEERYMLSEFAAFCKKQGRIRMQYRTDTPVDVAAKEIYQKFIEEKTIDYQQERLEEKYIAFRNLMREYEEGILLFEVTKEEVWDKAANDAAGIKEYFKAHMMDYTWNERAEVEEYSIRSTDPSLITKILKKVGKHSVEKTAASFNHDRSKPDVVMYTKKVYEKEDEEMNGLKWKEGAVTAPNINNVLKVTTFKKLRKINPASQKTLDDARGFVISDYQQKLEKDWILLLKQKYEVNIFDSVLTQLIK